MLIKNTLAGKHAVVCGASKGIGKACALELVKAGARVTILARQSLELETIREVLRGFDSFHQAIPCDFQELGQVAARLVQIGPQADILVCNSGGPQPGPVLQAKPEEFLQAFQQHVLANHMMIQHFVPAMKNQKYGRIIQIISTSVKIPLPGLGVSNTIRGAVANWAKTLANELAPYGITVNNILPGYTRTQRLEQIVKNQQQKTNSSQDEVMSRFLKEVPAGRFAEPEELAYACVFLASPFASYITGINLPVDGGRTGCL